MTTGINGIEKSELSFWTPVQYGDLAKTGTHKAIECIDAFFYLKGPVAVVISPPLDNQSTEVQFENNDPAFWLTILKIISYATLIIPTIMLIAKYALRSKYVFSIGMPGPNNSAIGSLLSNYRLADNAKRYSDLIEKIYSNIPEPDNLQLNTIGNRLRDLGNGRIGNHTVFTFEMFVNKGNKRTVWEDRLLKMTIAIYDAIMKLEGDELESGKEILITALLEAFNNCSNRQSTEIERLYFRYVAPELLADVAAASSPVETFIFELMKYRIMIRDEIINRRCPDEHNAASHRYFRKILDKDIFYLPTPLLCAEDEHYEIFALKDQKNAIIEDFRKQYENPRTIYDIFIGLIYPPKPNEKFHFKPAMFIKWLEENGRMNADAFSDEEYKVYTPEIVIAFLEDKGFLRKRGWLY